VFDPSRNAPQGFNGRLLGLQGVVPVFSVWREPTADQARLDRQRNLLGGNLLRV
jgi:hypothetical protein